MTAKSRLTALVSAALLALTLSVPALNLAFGADDDSSEPRDKDDAGQGPPAWSNAGGRQDGKKAQNDAWKQLTPSERHDLMADLVSKHKAGMADFQECKRAGGTACEKPVPPGLAKKGVVAKK